MSNPDIPFHIWKEMYPDAFPARYGGVCMAVPSGPGACFRPIRPGDPIVKLKDTEYENIYGGKSRLYAHAWCARGERRPIIDPDTFEVERRPKKF